MSPHMLGLSLNVHITNLMESFKDNSDLFSLTTMTKSEYDKTITNIANETTNKFFENNNKSSIHNLEEYESGWTTKKILNEFGALILFIIIFVIIALLLSKL